MPDGVGDIEPNDDGFTAKVSLATDGQGYFGRECPACQGPFKMHADEYEGLPDDTRLHCPYCGHVDEHSEFMTGAQRARVDAAVDAVAEQYVHGVISDMFGKAFRSRPASRRSMISVQTRYTP